MAESETDDQISRTSTQGKGFTTFLSHPVVVALGLIGSVASLISIPLAFYFYAAAKEYPQLTYYVHPVKATILRTGEASKLSASIDNKLVESDVTAVQIALWNQGARAIKAESVLKPIIISTENNTPILEATVRKASREVVKLSLDTNELSKGRVNIQWNILEQNDGGIIQLIYAGGSNLKFQVEGIIEGQAQIDQLEFSGEIKSPYEQFESERRSYKSLGYLLIALSLVLLYFAYALRQARGSYMEALENYQVSHQSRIESLDETIKWYEERVAYNVESHAELEKEASAM